MSPPASPPLTRPLTITLTRAAFLSYIPIVVLILGQGYWGLNWKWATERKCEEASKDRAAIIEAIVEHTNGPDVHLTSAARYSAFVTREEYKDHLRAIEKAQVADSTRIDLGFSRIEVLLKEQRDLAEQRYGQLTSRIDNLRVEPK